MNPSKSKLSKTILQMKFMKRTKEKVEKQMIEKEGEEYFSGQLPIQMKNESEKFIVEPSYVFCEKLIDGRLSFQGMNPELEKLLEIENIDKQIELEKIKETDVTDKQMVKQWINHRKQKNKFKRTKQIKNNTNQPSNKKAKFLKPAD